MKFLHLADLHLGKIIQEQSLIEDQEYMLKQITKIIKKEKINAVLISGDIYDKSIPTTSAVRLLNNFFKILIKHLSIKVFIIAGNHDSKERLGFGSEIFEEEGLYIESTYTGKIKKIEMQDIFGKINIYMLPFVKPIDVKKYFKEDLKNNYNITLKKIIEQEKINTKERNIILAHQFVTASGTEPERSESETISLGGIENVDISNFEKFDYVALGHIHRPQQIGRKTARYAGTMLKYSFSEINHNKTVPIIEMQQKGTTLIELKTLIPLRDMREIKGPIEELTKKENYKETNTKDYIKAIITNEESVYDAIGEIRKIYPNTLKLEFENSKTEQKQYLNQIKINDLKKKSEIELFEDFFKEQNNTSLNETEKEIIKKIIMEVKNNEAN